MNTGYSVDLSIIIVNWNSKEFLRPCLASIQAHTTGITYEVIVVDSGSFDGCEVILAEVMPQARFIQCAENVGFARANNEGFKVCHGENALFLNPDTTVTSGAIQNLHRWLRSLPSAGIVGPRLLNVDGSLQTTCVRAFPTIVNQMLESELLRRWFPHSRLWGMSALFAAGDKPSEVEAVSGACLMITRAAFERIGMFSDDYFMYSEDIDICYKSRQANYSTYHAPTAVVVHYGGASTSKCGRFASIMMMEARRRFFVKTRSLGYGRFFRVAVFCASSIRIVMAVLIWPVSVVFRRRRTVENAIEKWSARLCWSLGAERWVRELPPASENAIHVA